MVTRHVDNSLFWDCCRNSASRLVFSLSFDVSLPSSCSSTEYESRLHRNSEMPITYTNTIRGSTVDPQYPSRL